MSFKDTALGIVRSGKFFVNEHSPEILMITGGISIVGSIISACKATIKFQETVKKHNERLDKLVVVKEHQEAGTATEEENAIDIKSRRMSVYIETGTEAIKCYGPSLLLLAGGFMCFGGALGIFKKRYVSLAAAYAAVVKDKDHLESQIAEKYGDEVLQAMKAATPEKIIDVDEETGEVTETEKSGPVYSAYAKFFDESNENFEKNAESNKNFLLLKQKYLNHILHNRDFGGVGYLFLNEVYEALDMEKTQAGQVMGWIYYHDPAEAKKHPESSGKVDFGVFKEDSEAARRFVNGFERAILLDFNVDKLPIVGRTGFATA